MLQSRAFFGRLRLRTFEIPSTNSWLKFYVVSLKAIPVPVPKSKYRYSIADSKKIIQIIFKIMLTTVGSESCLDLRNTDEI